MRQPQRERLLRILRTQSESKRTKRMRGVMKEMLEDAGLTVRVENQQIFAWKGSADHAPFLVAHADTVHKIVPTHNYRVAFDLMDGEVVHHAYDPSTGKRRGVGGDDKCGLWLAQEVARNLDNVGVIITVDEEIGCIGARRVTADHLDRATVLIQADRRGRDDAVIRASGINISSAEWQENVKRNIETYGYKYCTFGAGTDVAAMHSTKAAKVSAINLSAGYYAPHSDDEYVREDHLENAFELALKLAERSAHEKWLHEAKQHVCNNTYQRTANQSSWVPYVDYFSNKADAILAGFHATHLMRDSLSHSLPRPEWQYDTQHRMQINKTTNQCAVYLSGGLLIFSIAEFNSIFERIRDSGFKPRFVGNHAYAQKPTAHTYVNDWFLGHVENVMKSKTVPSCGIAEGCVTEAKVFHSTRLVWGCDLHIMEAMEEDGLQYLSPRPSPSSPIVLPATTRSEGVDTHHWGEYSS